MLSTLLQLSHKLEIRISSAREAPVAELTTPERRKSNILEIESKRKEKRREERDSTRSRRFEVSNTRVGCGEHNNSSKNSIKNARAMYIWQPNKISIRDPLGSQSLSVDVYPKYFPIHEARALQLTGCLHLSPLVEQRPVASGGRRAGMPRKSRVSTVLHRDRLAPCFYS